MMKVKGVEYPISPCKFLLPDQTLDQLIVITKEWKMVNQNHTLTAMINQYYTQLIQSKEMKSSVHTGRQEEVREQSNGNSGDNSTDGSGN